MANAYWYIGVSPTESNSKCKLLAGPFATREEADSFEPRCRKLVEQKFPHEKEVMFRSLRYWTILVKVRPPLYIADMGMFNEDLDIGEANPAPVLVDDSHTPEKGVWCYT